MYVPSVNTDYITVGKGATSMSVADILVWYVKPDVHGDSSARKSALILRVVAITQAHGRYL